MRDQYFFSCLRTKQFGGKGQICFAKGRGIFGAAIKKKKKKKLIEKYQKKDNSLQLTHTHTHAHTRKNSLSL
jgi:microcystin-dependent protein